MSADNSPFSALDKMLFSPTPVEKKGKLAHSTRSSAAKQQSRKRAKSHSCESAKVQNSKAAKPQIRKAANPQDRQTATLREHGRESINHGLSIYEDQLFSLKEIQLERQKVLRKKYSLGDLAKEALDLFIRKERNQE